MKGLVIALAFLIGSSYALNCLTCGEDGACKNGTTAESKPCAGNQKSCALGFMKFENQFIEMKVCSPIPAQVTGCVDISLDGGRGDEKMCFCTENDCNAQFCSPEYCDCAFADQNECYKPNENDPIISCYCQGPECKEGMDGGLTECPKGVKSCQYTRMTFEGEERKLKSCAMKIDGQKKSGCYQVEMDDGFKGDICFCSSSECNEVECDPTHCDCAYADPNNCHDHDEDTETTTQPSSAVALKATPIILGLYAFFTLLK